MRNIFLPCLLLFGLVTATFLPSIRNEFVSYDDARYITANSHVQGGLTGPNVRWAFRSTAVNNWHPLTWLSHMADWSLFGSRAWGHHLVSLLLHAVNAVLVFLFLWRFTGATGRSFFAALIFGLHPLRVESVAWAAERKDVLSTFFGLLAILAYGRYVLRSARRGVSGLRNQQSGKAHRVRLGRWTLDFGLWTLDYCLALVFFALGLMSKPMLVTLPFGLLLLDYWPLGRVSGSSPFEPGPGTAHDSKPLRRLGQLLLEKAPFLLLAAGSCVVTFLVQRAAMVWMAGVPLSDRAANALVSYWRYLGKLFWPAKLSVIYPMVEWPGWAVALALIALLAVSVAAVAARRRAPYFFTGWFWYAGTLIPVIGLVAVGEQSMADRYTYMPSIGVLVAMAWGVHEWTRHWPGQAALLRAGSGAIALACILVTRQNLGYWRNTETLFRHAAQATAGNYRACVNLGAALFNQGRLDEALQLFQEAVRFRPDSAEAHADLGVAWHAKNRPADAIREYEAALRLKPDYAAAHFNLGTVLEESGQRERAIREYQQAASLERAAPFYRQLGMALARQGNLDEAILRLQQAVSLDPGNASMHGDLADALRRKGRREDAAAQFKEAIRLDPGNASARSNLNVLLNGKDP